VGVKVTGTDASVGAGQGGVRLQTLGASLKLNAGLEAGTRDVSLLSHANLIQTALGDVLLQGAGSLDVQADGIEMQEGAVSQSGTGAVRYQSAGTLQLGLISSLGSVSLIATSITDTGAASNTTVDVVANELRVASTGAVGEGTTLITTTVGRMSARAGTEGLFVSNTSALTLGQTAAVQVNRVDATGSSASQITDAVQTKVTSTGAVVVQAQGDLTLLSSGEVSAGGVVLLSAQGAGSDLVLGAGVTSSAGHRSLVATADAGWSGRGDGCGHGDEQQRWRHPRGGGPGPATAQRDGGHGGRVAGGDAGLD
jgi:hypothetical protein